MKYLPLQIKRSSRARYIRISVNCDAITVTAPPSISSKIIDEFVARKASWIKKTFQELVVKQKEWIVPEHVYQDSFVACRARARKFIRDRVKQYADVYKYSYRRIAIKDMKSRWGSCSKNKNLNFHYRLLFLPTELADYIVVHEVCHLKELNHSKKFWMLVSQTIPDYAQRRALLRDYKIS